MILLKDIKDHMKKSIDCPVWSISERNSKADKSITVYDAQTPIPTINIGGLKNTWIDFKTISILIHWGNNPTEAELKANEVFDFFYGKQHYIAGHRIIDINFRQGKPNFIGTDNKGVFEYVVDLTINYMKT
jgi:hypothetical protein